MTVSGSPTPEVTDWRGNSITVGDTVLYPRASGRSVEMREAVVLAIYRKDEDRYDWSRDADGAYVRTAVPDFKFHLQPTGPGSRGFYAGDQPVWVQNGENVTRA